MIGGDVLEMDDWMRKRILGYGTWGRKGFKEDDWQ